ncbi:MAG: peptidoglycan-binding protein [Clostridia bacterium]|jgi:hypothetical protein|nr:peptidoglycan-binding protein [Clostridia bacterium]
MINAFIEYLKEQVRNHSIYVWGGQGQQGSQITEQWIRDRETSARNADRVIKYWKKQVRDGYGDVLRAFDCSGLGCFFFQKNGLIPHDMTANGLKGQCDLIDRKDLQKGDLVFRCDQDGRAYHVGYVIDDGKNVIEAEGRDLGVREHRLKGWDRFGHPRFFNEHHSRLLKYRKPMMRGEDVTELQKALLIHGFDPGPVDGIFGKKTRAAVRAFQKATGLKTDGIAGPDTFAALGLQWED